MIYTKNLEDVIFGGTPEGADELVIISGYVGIDPIQTVGQLGLKVKVVYGMVSVEGISESLHKSLVGLDNKWRPLEIYYKKNGPVHAKCYIWRKDGLIIKSLIGSANFSFGGLNTPEKEILNTVDPTDFVGLNEYAEKVLSGSERCLNVAPAKIKKAKLIPVSTRIPIPVAIGTTLRFSLLKRNGELPDSSGINWGHGVSHTHRNDAYIRIPKEVIEFHPGFFDAKTPEGKVPVDLLWDDNTSMQGLAEGWQEFNNQIYPKQLSSHPEKKIMGKYLRDRMGVASEAKVTLDDFRRYGRDHIDITFNGPNSYSLDFSRPQVNQPQS